MEHRDRRKIHGEEKDAGLSVGSDIEWRQESTPHLDTMKTRNIIITQPIEKEEKGT